jgi:Ring finger domain
MTIRFPNFVSPRREQQRHSSAPQRRGLNSSHHHQQRRSAIPGEQERTRAPSPSTALVPPCANTPPASLAARQSLIHLRMRAPSKNECVICTQSFGVNDVVTTLPCGHMHHSKCILCWLQRKCTCPTCRYELPAAEEEDEDCDKACINSSSKQRNASTATLFNPLLGDSSGILGDENCRSGFTVYLADPPSVVQD